LKVGLQKLKKYNNIFLKPLIRGFFMHNTLPFDITYDIYLYMDKSLKKQIVSDYLSGKSSVKLSEELKISKPTILKVLNEFNVIRKRNRCESLNIIDENGNFVVYRQCPNCKQEIKTSSKEKTIACRNHFRKINDGSLCKPCSLELQKGSGNPFYGKKHNDNTKSKIALQITKNPPKQNSVSKKEKKLLTKIKKMKYKPLGSYVVGGYICDIYIKSLNLILEFNGDYWHCNPNKYDEFFLHPHKKITSKQIWDEDKIRIDNIKKYGYNLEVIWECDLDNIDNLIKILKKYDKN
jgi:hypothetical protein